jgi:hypothetical protein
MQQVLDNLAAGNYRQVITAALAKWRQLSQALQTSDTVVILDSCLFGYLTWTLFLTMPRSRISTPTSPRSRGLSMITTHALSIFTRMM